MLDNQLLQIGAGGLVALLIIKEMVGLFRYLWGTPQAGAKRGNGNGNGKTASCPLAPSDVESVKKMAEQVKGVWSFFQGVDPIKGTSPLGEIRQAFIQSSQEQTKLLRQMLKRLDDISDQLRESESPGEGTGSFRRDGSD